ncbi:DEP domain-containing mTOR-interacting protein [Senna tora]|uniref:DEP domain-containing mTOR-interacting protein n=1 Tax=Senna tora TaxID=362788 RepID=A0A834TVQ3_9FABA|nr:DEP domain-containing mTOR-interacting protein [Senna tora]
MVSDVEENTNPQELEKLTNGKKPNEEEGESCSQVIPAVTENFSSELNDDDNNNESSASENDDVRSLPLPRHDDDDDDVSSSADNHANRSAVIDNEINIGEEQVQIAQTDLEFQKPEEMSPEILNVVPSSTAENDDVPPRVVPADNHADNIANEQVLPPHSELPKPQTPPGISNRPPKNDDVSTFSVVDMPAIGKFFRERSSGFTAAIAKGISSFKDENIDEPRRVTEFNLSGLKVVVREKGVGDEEEEEVMKGRISFFSRSNCRDCTAVRKFLRETGLNFVEINIDVYTEREQELRERTGTTAVPQIFFNEKLFGGLIALNSLRNSGGFEQRLMKETMGVKCPDHAPAPPVYGLNANEEYRMDEMVGYVKVLRQKLPIQDRLIKMKMKMIQNCFTGAELVEVLIHHLDCGRKKAVEIAKQLSKKHFIHHVFGENDFEDGNHFYRFLEHEPFIPRCFNFWGITNDSEPKSAVAVCQRLTKIMAAILEAYASDDRRYLDYEAIGKSEEFRRYVNTTEDLQRVNLFDLSENEKLAIFLNLYNAMVIHAIVKVGLPQTLLDKNFFYSNFTYVVGGYPFSLNSIKNGILRCNRRPPYSLMKTFASGDRQLELVLVKMNPLIHFGLCNATKSCPKVRFFSPQGVADELRRAAREFFEEGGIEVDLEKRTVYLTRIIKWYDMDFGQEKDILKWVLNYLDATKAGFLTHLLSDGSPVHITYQNFDCVDEGERNDFWKLLWNWKGMEKIRSILWFCGHDWLLTNVARKRRGMAAMDICTRCNGAPEDLLHTLRDCPKAKCIWLKLVHPGK